MNVLLSSVLQALLMVVLVAAAPDGFNVYKDTLRGRNDDEGDDDDQNEKANVALLSKMIRYYRTPLHILTDAGFANVHDGNTPAAITGSDVVTQFRKRTVSKFKSAFLYYLTHDLAHLQNFLLLDALLATNRAHFLVDQRAGLTGGVGKAAADLLVQPEANNRSVYIPRASV